MGKKKGEPWRRNCARCGMGASWHSPPKRMNQMRRPYSPRGCPDFVEPNVVVAQERVSEDGGLIDEPSTRGESSVRDGFDSRSTPSHLQSDAATCKPWARPPFQKKEDIVNRINEIKARRLAVTDYAVQTSLRPYFFPAVTREVTAFPIAAATEPDIYTAYVRDENDAKFFTYAPADIDFLLAEVERLSK